MNILIAPNAFKNSLTADAVAEAINIGLQQSHLSSHTICFPIGDGGDGTAALLLKQLGAEIIDVTVQDPKGREIRSFFGITNDHSTAVIELADASGLRLLEKQEYDPLHTTSFGTGQLIEAALKKNVKKIILCIGGSATVDGGMGILQALGAVFYDEKNNILEDGPASLLKLSRIDISAINKKIYETELTVLCDVENHLLGEKGAAKIFGPQKGALQKDVEQLDTSLANLRDIALGITGKDMDTLKHGGAAGGVAACLSVFFNAKLVNGINYFLDITGFHEQLMRADLLITGEGSIDAQTLNGKGPYGVATLAKERSIPVIGIAGKIPLTADKELDKYFDALIPINHESMDLDTAIKCTHDNLIRTGKLLGDLLSMK